MTILFPCCEHGRGLL